MNDIDATRKEKHSTIQRLLREEYLLVHVNPFGEGVDLPEHLRHQQSVTLKLSRLFRGGVQLETGRVVSDLLFGAGYYSCVLPLDAIWGVTSSKGNNILWPESTPAEVLDQILSDSKRKTQSMPEAPTPTKKSGKKGAPHLKRVK